MRERVGVMICVGLVGAAIFGAMTLSVSQVQADDPNSAPNPYHVVEHWAKLPEGQMWGQAIGVDIDRDGTSLWVFDRCGGKTCVGSSIAPIQKFDATGRQVVSFGSQLINWPHGLGADSDGNVWSGGIEARTGLRMMPTFPRSPLSFRTAGFPQYGWKAGVSDETFPARQSA